MNPEERHLWHWLQNHRNPAVLAFVDAEFRAQGDAPTMEPESSGPEGYEAWVARRILPDIQPLDTAPFNFARFIREGSFLESFERIGTFYIRHAYPEDGRLKARLRQIWSPTSWTRLESSAQDYTPAQDLAVIRIMADDLRSASVKERVAVVGLYAFSCAAGRRYWRQAERVATMIDPSMRHILRGFVVRNQLSDREKHAPHFRDTLAKILEHGATK